MAEIIIRELTIEDKKKFLDAMQRSKSLHYPWVNPPLTSEEFDTFLQNTQKPNQKCFLICDESENIAGVFNINEIVRGLFQNAYLGFQAVIDYAGKGHMSAGLKLVLEKAFNVLQLHRLEANIQPENTKSILLVQKNGFRYEGFSPRYLKINNEWRAHERWAITFEDFIRNDPKVMLEDHVELVPYNAEWPSMAKDEIEKLQSIFPSIIDIQHIGSTAIPNISSKPIIDIQIAVRSLAEAKLFAVPILQKLGYEYWDDNPDHSRMFFVKGMPPYGEKRTHHVHIFEYHSDHWRNKLAFRDFLRSHPSVAKEYEQLKFKLAKEHTKDREKYTEEKIKFINKVLQRSKTS